MNTANTGKHKQNLLMPQRWKWKLWGAMVWIKCCPVSAPWHYQVWSGHLLLDTRHLRPLPFNVRCLRVAEGQRERGWRMACCQKGSGFLLWAVALRCDSPELKNHICIFHPPPCVLELFFMSHFTPNVHTLYLFQSSKVWFCFFLFLYNNNIEQRPNLTLHTFALVFFFWELPALFTMWQINLDFSKFLVCASLADKADSNLLRCSSFAFKDTETKSLCFFISKIKTVCRN